MRVMLTARCTRQITAVTAVDIAGESLSSREGDKNSSIGMQQ
jgi:hypothetical protein